MLILGLESSCDETAAAVVENGLSIRSNIIASQHDLHGPFGGVVPEVAARAHAERITAVVEKALQEAACSHLEIDAVSVVHRPGLVGALLVGVAGAKGLALAWEVPLIGIDHIQGHVYASCLAGLKTFPHLSLIVSGGHTCLYRVDGPLAIQTLGQTTDDAAGEAFDKVAKLLGLGFPGGPALSRCATQGNPQAVAFPRCGPNEKPGATLDFSFSGLKTAVYYHLRRLGIEKNPEKLDEKTRADVAASFQEAACEILVLKTLSACRQTGIKTAAIGGGVACNGRLRSMFAEQAGDVEIFFPPPSLCTDNAAMSAGLAYHHFQNGECSSLDLEVDPTPKRASMRS